MEFRCEGLPEHGLPLVPPSSDEYETLLSDIRQRTEAAKPGLLPMPNPFRNPIPEKDRETAAILLNRSGQGISAMRFVWRFEGGPNQWSIRSGTILPGPPQMFPQNWPAKSLPQGIMPGSKRYLAAGYAFGDNSDVLPLLKHWMPEFSEIEEHGSAPNPERANLSLDGVFFVNGGFVGANQYHLWEQVVFAAEEQRRVSELARERRNAGAPPEFVLDEIGTRTGPSPGFQDRPMRVVPGRDHPEAYRVAARQKIAQGIAGTRAMMGDELAVQTVIAWADKPMPNFRRLS